MFPSWSSAVRVESTHAEAHLADGRFDSERMLRFLNEAMETALTDGFTGLRTCGDMSWLLKDPVGADQVAEYEALLNQFFHGVLGAGMCQSDLRRLPPALIDLALATHTSVVVDGQHKLNRFYRSPSMSTTNTSNAADLNRKLRELRQHS